jgi:DNA polymerase I-like protein with 3'-5' exonuclease and polymerase domains
MNTNSETTSDLDTIDVHVVGLDDLPALAAELGTDAWRPAIDTETVYRQELEVDGIPGQVRVISLAVRRPDGSESAWVIDLRDTPASAVAQVLAPLDVVGFNANFDEHALALVGLRVTSWYDAMIADTVCRSGRTGVNWYRGLAALAKIALGIELDGKGTVQTSYDATTDLTADQVRYAGLDAVVTRRVADWVRTQVTAAGLDEAVELENGARPFINAMMVNGVPFDLHGYLEGEIAAKQAAVTTLLATLAELTEVRTEVPKVQMSLFGPAEAAAAETGTPAVVPSWNPNSKPELIAALNRWAEPAVRAYTDKVYGTPRLLMSTDTLRKDDLRQIDSDIVRTLLKLKAAAKEVTTYGDDLARFWRNGRFFSRYKQGGLVSTGRLASFNFNAQNLSKPMLKWMRPADGRVLVYGDISQAELRYVAHAASENEMIDAFASGEDFHLATARVMNPGVDLAAIAEEDPGALKKMRTAAKSVNFGLVYGMAAGLLAKNLTVSGIDTDKNTAQGYLSAYFAARPRVAQWLKDRDAYVDGIANRLPGFDWVASLELYRLRLEAEGTFRSMKKKLKRAPEFNELAKVVWPNGPRNGEQLSEDRLEAFWAHQANRLAWAFSYEGAVLLREGGQPFEFYSTTASGRRRVFDISMDSEGNDKFSGFIICCVLEMCERNKAAGASYLAEFADAHGLKLPSASDWRANRLQARADAVKAFEGSAGKMLRLDLVCGAVERFGLDAIDKVFRKVAASCVRGQRNAFRNHPVQGSVADIVEAAFAAIMAGLPDGAFPIISVHDSITIECDEADADMVAELLRDAVEAAMGRFCGTVTAKVDVDVRASLDDDDVLRELPARVLAPA